MEIKKPTPEEFEQYLKDCNIHGYKTPYETLKSALEYFFGLYQTQNPMTDKQLERGIQIKAEIKKLKEMTRYGLSYDGRKKIFVPFFLTKLIKAQLTALKKEFAKL